MINVSDEYREFIKQDRNFVCRAEIVLADGTVIEITNDNIMGSGFCFEDGVSGDGSFDIGAAVINQFTLTLDNTEETYSDCDFTGAVIYPEIGLKLSETVESLKKGVFTVDTAVTQSATITITALDNMNKFDKSYDSTISYPASLGTIVNDACTRCGVALATGAFDNSGYIVQSRPEGEMTYREVISYAAQVAGCYARCNMNGELELKWYYFSFEDFLDGGNFRDYESGDSADGGNFNTYYSGDRYDGGTFDDMDACHHIYALGSQDINTDDVLITGIQVTEQQNNADSESEEVTCLYGSEGYVLSISDNPFIQAGQGKEVAAYLGQKLVGVRFRPLTVTALSDPSIEAGDLAYISDRKGNGYFCPITNLSFTVGDYETFTCDAETPSKNNSTQYSVMTKAVVKARRETQKAIDNYDLAVSQLNDLAVHSFGVYKTKETLPDGSVIYYMHDKPTLAESQTIWKQTASAFAVSTDGGETYSAGFDSNGNAVLNVLSAIGINADWVNIGGAADGVLNIRDASGKVIVCMNKDGITMADGASIISDSGVCGSLQYITNGGSPQFLGYDSGHLAEAAGTKASLILTAFIPQNYVITSAVVSLITCATTWTYLPSSSTPFRGYGRSLKLYVSTDQSGLERIAYYPGSFFDGTSGNWNQIVSGQFTSGGIAGSSTNVYKTDRTGNIANYLNAGALNVLKIESDDTYSGTSDTEYLRRTGTGIAILSLMGYMRN